MGRTRAKASRHAGGGDGHSYCPIAGMVYSIKRCARRRLVGAIMPDDHWEKTSSSTLHNQSRVAGKINMVEMGNSRARSGGVVLVGKTTRLTWEQTKAVARRRVLLIRSAP
jgi:hypothetical protein